jgi:sec-independent protein translocase protein TatA
MLHRTAEGAVIMGGIGLGEFILILAVLVLVFGGGKLPELGNSLGKAIRSFRRASSTNEDIQVLPKADATKEPPADTRPGEGAGGAK